MKCRSFVSTLRHPFGERQTIPTLLHLAKRGKFDSMVKLLESEDHRFYLDECADSANHHGTLNLFLGRSTLQLVMSHRPPIELVDLLIRRCREHNPDHCPEDSIDMQGRTPLHIAVQHGCSIETCKRLMNDNLPVIMKDQMDRTPLHYACANLKCYTTMNASCKVTKGTKQYLKHAIASKEADNSYQIICALVTAYPLATQIPDVYGKTPIMIATENRADKRIITVLANVSHCLEQQQSNALFKIQCETSMYTITSECFTDDDDVSSVGSCGVSTIEI
jgi:hypothetical protein